MSVFTSDGTENRMRWDERSAPFMEVWYATLNHKASGLGLWFRYTITAPATGAPSSALWGFAFDPAGRKSFAAKNPYPIDRLGRGNGRDDGALVRIGNAWLSENHLEGEVDVDDRSLAWSLDFDPSDLCFQHLPAPIRTRVERRISTVCSPNLSVPFSGTVKLDGESLELDGEMGCQSHRWGKSHSESWTWAHCSQFDEADAVFEGVAARSKLGPLPLPTSTFVFLRHDGEDIPFNEMRWALRARSRYELPFWEFEAHNDRFKITGAAHVAPERMVQVTYTDPDGSRRFCANSEIADLSIELSRKSGSEWKHERTLTASGTAHLEFGRRDPFSEIAVSF